MKTLGSLIGLLRRAWDGWVQLLGRLADWFLSPWLENVNPTEPDWAADADAARLAQAPLRARKLLHVTIL
ncbi:MAG: hypothetical protein ACKO4A_13060, partial [Gammaproteobacteria bacterium]